MNWYLAKLVYRIVCGAGAHTPQFDEQLRLVYAEDELEAFHKARKIGHQEQDEFDNQRAEPVRWQFLDVTELHRLEQITDGAEVYSRIREEKDGDAYAHTIHVKAAHLLDHCSSMFLANL